MLKAKKFGNRDKAIKKKVIPAIKFQIQKLFGYTAARSTEITISFLG
jgi:hypothetical protein